MATLDWTDMPIHQAIKADWHSPEILVEGSLGSAKTTVALDKEIDALLKWPGIPSLLFRWTEDATATKLKTAFEELLHIRGLSASWDQKEKRYVLDNGSAVFMFGLKAQTAIERFNKIRGVGACRICGDQVEEMERSVADELRGRLRPNLTATVRDRHYPFQLTFVANPSGDDFWLSKQFPVDNHIKGRKLYSLSVFDNKHLPKETIESLLRTFPPEHPKHQTMVLGRRGLNVTGDPIYESLFDRTLHVRPAVPTSTLTMLEGFEFGRHNPTWVIGQRSFDGKLSLFGGIMGKHMVLEDFLPIVKRYREDWFPGAMIKTCTAPMGETQKTTSGRYTLLGLLREAGFRATWNEKANAPDVQLATIEYIAGLLRRRIVAKEESFAVNNDPAMWLTASSDGTIKPVPFISFALEGGYIWDDHAVSVSNKAVRQPFEDDEYANAMHCVENIVLNFCAGQRTESERASRKAANREDPQEPNRERSTMDWAS